MKILFKNIIYLLFITLFNSCSESEFIIKKPNKKTNVNTNHWVTHKQPKNSEKLLANSKTSLITTKMEYCKGGAAYLRKQLKYLRGLIGED